MKEFNEKQIKIANRVNEILEISQNVQDWLEIAYQYIQSEDEKDFSLKCELLFNLILSKHTTLHNTIDKLFADLHELI